MQDDLEANDQSVADTAANYLKEVRINESELLAEGVRASALEITQGISEHWVSQGIINYGSLVDVDLDEGELDSPDYAGYFLTLTRFYGPRPNSGESVRIENILAGNRLELSLWALSRKQGRDSLMSQRKMDQVEQSLRAKSTEGAGFKFNVRQESVRGEGDKAWIINHMIYLEDIRDQDDMPLDSNVGVDLGFSSDDISDDVYRARVRDEIDLAQANMREGEFMASHTVPRSYGVAVGTSLPESEGFNVDDSELLEKLRKTMDVLKMCLETIIEVRSSNTESIIFHSRTAEEMLQLSDKRAENMPEWMKNIE